MGHHDGHDVSQPRDEKKLVSGAVRTDLILSTEIMLISLANLDPDLGFWSRLGALVVIGVLMTVVVYGAVALLVKLDDGGLRLMKSEARSVRRFGVRVVYAMPAVFGVIGVVGTVAMLWVGGHLVLANVGTAGFSPASDLLHSVEHLLEPLGGVVVWLGDTLLSAVAGLLIGTIIVMVGSAMSRLRRGAHIDVSTLT